MSIPLFGQIPSFEGNKSTSSVLLQKVVPPSPTATSLGKYGDQQVSMFTGTSQVNIPIYNINTIGFSIPLTLSYSTSGLRVSEAASWVGLGWSLNGTGVITRVVKGIPDGVQYPINIRTFPLPLTYTKVSDNAWDYIHAQIQLGTLDPEPDIYIVRTGKLSFKFYYDLHKRIQTIPYNNDIKIKFDGTQYTVTDADGTQYIFGGTQANEIAYSSNPAYAAYTSSWFLSKIITPSGSQILYNNIKGSNTILQDQYSETEEVKPSGQSGDAAIPQPAGRSINWSSQTFQPVFLNSIETDQEIVYLTRDINERADLPGDFALKNIKVYSKISGRYVFNYTFNYSIFPQVSSICWGNSSSPQHSHNKTSICKRLRLDQFIENGDGTNSSGTKTYQFQYNSNPVPSRCSLDQDYWGYYNGAGNSSLLPSVTDPNFQSSSYNAVSRESNHNVASAGMLQKIIYPTGGETNFTYEANEVNSVSYGSYQTITSTLSGISPSTENSVTFTLSANSQVTINYTLSDQNLLDQGLQRKVQVINQSGTIVYSDINTNTTTAGILVTDNPNPLGGLAPGTYTLKVSRNYSYSSYPSVPAVSLIATVKYAQTSTTILSNRKVGGYRIKRVTDKEYAAGNEIKVKEYSYENPVFVADIKSADCISSYTRWFLSSSSQQYQCNFKSRNTSTVQPIGTVQGAHLAYGKVICFYGSNGSNGKSEYYYSTDADIGGYSLSPIYKPITSYDHRRGNLLRQNDFDISGILKRTIANNYDVTLKYAGLYTTAYYTKDAPIQGIIIDHSLISDKTIAYSDFALPSEWVRIKNSSQTVFDGVNSISTINEYNYENPNYSFVTKTTTTNSQGDILTRVNKYPLDSKPITTAGNEEIERKFETDYQTLFNNFVTCDNAASTSSAITSCYNSYQSGYDNLLNTRASSLSNYLNTFTSLANGTSDPILKAKYQLLAKNKVGELLESTVYKNTSIELNKTVNEFKDFSGNILLEKINTSIAGNSLQNDLIISSYDTYGNMTQGVSRDGIIQTFIWDYKNQLPIAKMANAASSAIAHTSFEADGKGNWTFAGSTIPYPGALSGSRAYNLSAGNITKSLTSTSTYMISYWRPASLSALSISGTVTGYPIAGRVVNGWKYYEHKVTGQGTATISGSGLIDELRLYPFGAQMKTFTYNPLVGITSECDEASHLVYYYYDAFSRLILVRDQDKNILKKYCYNYQGQTNNCTVYQNVQKSGSYTKLGCSGCTSGTAVTYTVPAGTYISTVSQADADIMATNDLSANGQAYANSQGSCAAPTAVTISVSNSTGKSFAINFYNITTSCTQPYPADFSSSVSSITSIKTGTYDVTVSPAGGPPGQYTLIINGLSNGSSSDTKVIRVTFTTTSTNSITIQP